MRSIRKWIGNINIYDAQPLPVDDVETRRLLNTPISKLTIQNCITIAMIFAKPVLTAAFILGVGLCLGIVLIVTSFGIFGSIMFIIASLFDYSPVYKAGVIVFITITVVPVFWILTLGGAKMKVR